MAAAGACEWARVARAPGDVLLIRIVRGFPVGFLTLVKMFGDLFLETVRR